MDNITIFADKQHLAEAAAKDAVTTLAYAIESHGNATWVLAGGTMPEVAYNIIAKKYLGLIDWSKVTFLIGDERIAPLDSSDSNWHVAQQALLRHIPHAIFVRPASNDTAENAADDYNSRLQKFERFDLVWLGMGEDGHTLSLFPHHPDFLPTDRLVIPIHHSPKPPSDRITLTLPALERAEHTVILTAGKEKAEAFKNAQKLESLLPIAQAARITTAQWYVDHAAAKSID